MNNNNTEESNNANPVAEAVLIPTIRTPPVFLPAAKYTFNFDGVRDFAFNNPLTRKNVSNLYFCDMTGPFSLIYFERIDEEDPYPPMFCQPALIDADDNKRTIHDDETVHTEFLKNNNIITMACRRKKKEKDEGRLTPSGKLKYYFIYFSKKDNRIKDKINIRKCLANLATVSSSIEFQFVTLFLKTFLSQ